MRRSRARAAAGRGPDRQTVLTALAVVAGLAALAVAVGAHAPSALRRIDRQKRMEADCVARGGRLVQRPFPERVTGDRACNRG